MLQDWRQLAQCLRNQEPLEDVTVHRNSLFDLGSIFHILQRVAEPFDEHVCLLWMLYLITILAESTRQLINSD